MNTTKQIILRQMVREAVRWSNKQVETFSEYDLKDLVAIHYDAQSDLIDLLHDFLRKEGQDNE